MYGSLQDAITDAEARKTTLAAVALEIESRDQGRTVADIRAALEIGRASCRERVFVGV